MSSYIGHHAELYDVFYSDKPYVEEAAFVDQCLQRYEMGSTHGLLELACGTGSHALVLEKSGYEIVAVDYSRDMLACAKRKAIEVNSSIDFRLQDMRALDVDACSFDAVICLFDSIGYVKTNDALLKVLESVHRCLRTDGLFILEFWHAAAMLRHYDPVRVRRWSTPNGQIVRISETNVDPFSQVARVRYSIYESCDEGRWICLEETQTNRFFSAIEMAGWLSFCGFEPITWFAGFSFDENITDKTWHIVAVVRKRGESSEG